MDSEENWDLVIHLKDLTYAQVFETLPQKYKLNKEKLFAYESEGSNLILKTNRQDLIQKIKKEYFRKKEIRLFVKDVSAKLKLVYPQSESESLKNYYEVPLLKWDGLWMSRFRNLQKGQLDYKKERNLIVEEYTEYPEAGRLFYLEEQLEKELLKEGWVRNTNVKGVQIFLDKYIELESKIKRIYKEEVLDKLPNPYSRCYFAPIISTEDLTKTQYYMSCIENLFYILKIKDAESLKLKYHLQNYLDPKAYFEKSSGVHSFVNYCSCQGLWPGFKNENFKGENALFFYDDTVTTFRNEHGKVRGLQRLEAFNRMELVFATDNSNIMALISLLKSNLVNFFKRLRLPFYIEKTLPWFAQEGEIQNKNTESPFTYDFQLKTNTTPVELGNLSNNSSYWTKSYNFKMNNRVAASGCSGIGLQRLVNAYLNCSNFEKEYKL